ncbi:TIGR00730 family Rossman fold protein [Ramlibacter sp. AW1]|uniref:Cytokinin riboside 5'-monophosphate phosphoribohydrolase n=1 Tax=Ramlibacter aurantiacus TaxID=2801330 RepID=A0A937D337_9BURK|nr:TIGR00730 family Rossman fold protein [Ramlibacter aurantiacus]MBL0420335.1 TIGR00730 family Rossman fold protein [Ramlibacter aurantiacus]
MASRNIHDQRLADAWATLQAHSDAGLPLTPEASRLAFADPEFLLRRETRGIRFQLELLKPDLGQIEHGIENTIVVFGSARFRSQEEADALLAAAEAGGDETTIRRARTLARNARYYEQARAFGQLVARYSSDKEPSDKLFICTGGGPGIMQAANRGAFEADGISVGLSIALPMEEAANPYVTPALSFKFHYFALRKMHFMMRAKALVAFPGGFGTLDELFEVITLVQTRKSRQVPIVLFGSDYWKRLINFDTLVEEGVISPNDLSLFQYADDPEAAWDVIRGFYNL